MRLGAMRTSLWRWAGLALLGCGGAAPAAKSQPEAAPVSKTASEPVEAPLPLAQLEALARARDPRGIEVATRALASEDDAVRLLAARALVDYGAAARDARAALSFELSREPAGELAGTIAWALLQLDADGASDTWLERLGDGSLARATRLDGSTAFDLARLRQFAARFRADPALRERYVRALGDGVGGAALVAELGEVSPDPTRAFFERKRVFDVLDRLNDPGAAEPLWGFLQQKPHIYFETRAAQALARLGDLRAAPLLAARLRRDPLEVYGDATDWEISLRRDDQERVSSARLLADLAAMHPKAHAELVAAAEAALIFWIHELPSPHANGMRALAAMGSRKDLAALRSWANPQVRLPLEGQQPPMPEEWVIAQSALRYVGALKDGPSRAVLLQALQRRPRELNVTMDNLMTGGVAILGMALRAIGTGAADGLAEWGDASGFQPLLKYVDDPWNNEHAQLRACVAMGQLGSDRDLLQLAQRLNKPLPADTKNPHLARCLLEALRQRPVPGMPAALLPLMSPQTPRDLMPMIARAIGRSSLDAATEAALGRLLGAPSGSREAALALMLGGSQKAAAGAVAALYASSQTSLEALADVWSSSFDFVSRSDVEDGTLLRYIDNAQAIAALELPGEAKRQRQRAPLKMLAEQLRIIEYDNGPRSVTRPVLLAQLRQAAASPNVGRAQGALKTLVLLRAIGDLQALARAPSPGAPAARAAYLEAVATPAPPIPSW